MFVISQMLSGLFVIYGQYGVWIWSHSDAECVVFLLQFRFTVYSIFFRFEILKSNVNMSLVLSNQVVPSVLSTEY